MKFSQISIVTPNSATDYIVGVTSGNVDGRYPINSIAGRMRLTANTTFYASPTGSDVTGNGTVGNPYATPQHLFDTVGANVDAGGNVITYKFADGTYVGGTVKQVPLNLSNNGMNNGLIIQGNNASPGNVIFNDVGAIFTPLDIQAEFVILNVQGITFAPQTAGSGGGVGISFNGPVNQCYLSNIVLDSTGVASPGDAIVTFVQGTGLWFAGNITVKGNWQSVFDVGGTNSGQPGLCSFNVLGSPDLTFGGTPALMNGIVDLGDLCIAANLTNINVVGSYTGPQATNTAGVLLGTLSGGSSGITTNSGFTNGVFYIPHLGKSGLPATSDLLSGTAAVFKDTSGGGVYLAYNDAGTIKKVALT